MFFDDNHLRVVAENLSPSKPEHVRPNEITLGLFNRKGLFAYRRFVYVH